MCRGFRKIVVNGTASKLAYRIKNKEKGYNLD